MGRQSIAMFATTMVIMLCAALNAETTFDPLAIGVGARALGMGRAYVAVAEDGDTIFNNPAGLGEIDSFKFTSMSGSILEDVSYTVLGGIYPTGEKSAVGIGFVSASVAGIAMRDSAGNFLANSDFNNSVFIFSFGKKLSEKFSLGANLKYFSQAGSGYSNGSGTGANFDVGILQSGLGWLTLGAVGQNLFSSGKITYKNGEEEAFPLTLKVGAKMHILGQQYTAALLSPMKLNIVLDAITHLQGTKPTTLHAGAEFSPSPLLTLRAGVDQDPLPGGTQSNLTSGISLRLAGIGFHYAYHAYTEISANSTHYFSLSFDDRGWPIDAPPEMILGQN